MFIRKVRINQKTLSQTVAQEELALEKTIASLITETSPKNGTGSSGEESQKAAESQKTVTKRVATPTTDVQQPERKVIKVSINKYLPQFQADENQDNGTNTNSWSLSEPNDDPKWNELLDIWTDFYGMECSECNSCFYRFEKFMAHIEKKHKGHLRCTECQLMIKVSPQQLEYHINYHTNPSLYRCKICNTQEFSPEALKQHHSRVHGVKKELVCSLCDMAFLKESFLEEHNRERHEKKAPPPVKNKIICQECGFQFKSEVALNCHLYGQHKIYKSKDKKICDVCDKVYYTTVGFQKHFRTHLKLEVPKINCPLCSETLADKASLKVHIRRRHSKQEPQTCPHCKKQCRSQSALSAHISYVHLFTSKHKCTMCDKAYRKKYELMGHMAAAHTGLADFQCNYCTRKFVNQPNKFKHMKAMHPVEFELGRKFKKIETLPTKIAQKI